jgi:hypothetical protein
METYTVQLTLAVTVTVDHDRPNNIHSIYSPQYDAHDHAYAVIADFVRNTPNVSFVIPDDLTADVHRHD